MQSQNGFPAKPLEKVAVCGYRTDDEYAESLDIIKNAWSSALDPRNFHRKATSTVGFVEPTGRATDGQRGRPAQLFRRGDAAVLYPPLLRP